MTDLANLHAHDAALRDVTAAVAAALAEGASLEAIAMRVLLPARGLSLGGPLERADAVTVAGIVRGES